MNHTFGKKKYIYIYSNNNKKKKINIKRNIISFFFFINLKYKKIKNYSFLTSLIRNE